MDEQTPPHSPAVNDAEDRSLRDDLRQLAADARALAEAELAYQKTRAVFAARESRNLAILGALAAALAFFGLMALVVGAVIALAPALTPWGATAAVAGVLFLLALACVLVLRARASRMKEVLSDETSSDA